MKKLISIIVLLAMLVCAIIMAIPAAGVLSEAGDYDFIYPPIKKNPLWDELLTLDGIEVIDYYDFVGDVDYMLHNGTLVEVKTGIFSYDDYPEELAGIIEDFLGDGDTFEKFKERNRFGDIPWGAGAGYGSTRSDADDYDVEYELLILGNDEKTFSVNLCVVTGMFQQDRVRDPNAKPKETEPEEQYVRVDLTGKTTYPIPCPSDELEWSLEYFAEECEKEIPATGDIDISFVNDIPSEVSDIITENEMMILEAEGMVRVSGYPQSSDDALDNYCLVKYQDGYFVLIYKTEPNTAPFANYWFIATPGVVYSTSDDSVETEPVETDAPGTGGTEPVVAPKTVDRLALIAGALVVSLTLCAAAFTVVKAKKR